MKQKHLVDEMISIRDEMKNINNRIQATSSLKNYEFINQSKSKFKIEKYCNQLIEIKPTHFQQYFISDQFLLDLLQKRNYEKLLQILLKFIVDHFQNQEFIKTQSTLSESPEKNKRINKMIQDVISPIKSKIESQTQFFNQQLKINHRSCQTQPCHIESQQEVQLNQGIRKQSSMISSMYEETINSPKFNENTNKLRDEVSFEKQFVQKGIDNLSNHLQINRKNQNEIKEIKYPYSVNLLTTPKYNKKQFRMDQSNSCASIKDTIRKYKYTNSFEQVVNNNQDDDKKLRKQLQQTMISLDLIQKRTQDQGIKNGSCVLFNY